MNGRVPPPRPTTVRWPPTRCALHGQLQGVIRADEVEHELGPEAGSRGPDALDGVVIGAEHLVGAQIERLRELDRIGVDHDESGRRQGAEDLDREMAQPTGADDDGRGPGYQQGQRTLDRVRYGVRPASTSGADSIGSRPSSGTSRRSGTHMNFAMPPS